MSYRADLAKLKKKVRAYKAGLRKTPPRMLACCVCPVSRPLEPTVETRFGPRCAKHLPQEDA